MLRRRLFLSIGLFFLPLLTSFVVATEVALPLHQHPYLIDRHSAVSERFMGMLYLIQCNRRLAKFWLEAALTHDPASDETKAALAALDTWPKEESARIYKDAKRRGSRDLADYYKAITCDPGNTLAAREADRILSERDKERNVAKQ